ncbi:glucan endo-1,3-beta-glucosidase 9 [Magnolia sinica]|uniref:glucan endo-1,3-beta-glucosidase 9 n=1 Tax=Magnolia sinica TaxID=86752 RepID=UPI0026598909|nr:glucan endo-1,3-beta-glucosidase 9 [Magnolia sinica]
MATTVHLLSLLFFFLPATSMGGGIGVNWGTLSSHPLPPPKVVAVLQSNNISKVKLFDADPLVLESLSGSGINVIVGIPNAMLRPLSSSKKVAESWVHDNISRYFSNGGAAAVRIEYIAVGDEPLLQSYGEQFKPFIVGAATNIQLALIGAKLANKVKVVIPCNSDIYLSNSTLPSKGHFRPDLNKTMTQLLSFLSKHGSPFVINIYPFLSLHHNKNFSLGYALFRPTAHPLIDGHNTYKNSFDASIDTLVAALSRVGFADMDIIVGQIGWPTDGAMNASSIVAQSFMKGLMSHLQSRAGTPLRPRRPPIDTYIFSLLDEDRRSIANGNFERHWGVFTFDGQAKYHVDLGQGSRDLANAQNVEYLASKWCVVDNNKDLSNASASAVEACSVADCTTLSLGGSCYTIDWPGNVSYAFNSYYQQHDQRADSCDFGGLALITIVDPSVGECRFPVGLRTSLSTSLHGTLHAWWTLFITACISVWSLGFT